MSARSQRFILLVAIASCLVGCKSGVIPNPNDPPYGQVMDGAVLHGNIVAASDALSDRKNKHEITDEQYRQMMADYVNDLLKNVDIAKIPVSDASFYGDAFRTAKRWNEAVLLLTVSVNNAPNGDRFVNDSLRLAQCLCSVGRVGEGIKAARKTFSTAPTGKAPILTAVLLEIVPAGRGKGDDLGLASLLEDAIYQSEQTVVDANTLPGQSFLVARPYHVGHAWDLILSIYQDNGRADLVEKARKKGETRKPSALATRLENDLK